MVNPSRSEYGRIFLGTKKTGAFRSRLPKEVQKMKKLRYPCKKEDSDYLRMRLQQNIIRSKNNKNELLIGDILKRIHGGAQWRHQSLWGFRIFDWWLSRKGAAVEVDGDEHDINYDAYRDEYNFRRSAIVVFRVKNGDFKAAEETGYKIKRLNLWKERRKEIKIDGSSKKARRALAMEENYPEVSYLKNYLNLLSNKSY